MSTSLLYQGFGIRGYRYLATRYEGGTITVRIEAPRESWRCSRCGSDHVHLSEWFPRWWRTLPIGSKAVFIEMDVPQVECQDCGAKRRIAIDEIHLGKQYRFITLVLDLDTGAVVFVGNGKGKEALKPFWKRLRSSGAKVRAVATDMSPAYIAAVRENLPQARLVFDRFHVTKLLNEKLTELRRQLYREAIGPLDKKVLKGIRWLLLMNPENLDDEKGQRAQLQLALDLNQPLAIAYYLKDELRQFWQQPDYHAADRFLASWCNRAEASGIRVLMKFANTLRAHRAGLLAWYAHPISTGPLEGVNNKIKLMQRRAYGYRDLELFKLRILSLHETRYELVG